MPTLADLHSIHSKELELTLAESDLLLQKEGGLDGELKTSGSLCEMFIRSTLAKYIVPGQYRVTSGYIATPALLEKGDNLPQCDVVVADNHLPALLRLAQSTIEVVPKQAVISFIETKRTLDKSTLSKALEHLNKIVESIGSKGDFKTDAVLNGANKYVLFHNHSSDKPLIGVIAMKSAFVDFSSEVSEIISQKNSLVDFVWTLDGNALIPGFQEDKKKLYYTHSARPVTKTWGSLTSNDFSDAYSEFYKQFSGSPTWFSLGDRNGQDRAQVFAKMIGILSLTFSRIFPGKLREEEINAYFLNTPNAPQSD